MRIEIPADLPQDQHDEYCRAFRAGFLEVQHPNRTWADRDVTDHDALANSPAFHAGMNQAWRTMMQGVGR